VTRICDNCTGKLAMSVDYTSCKCLRYQQARTNVLAIMPNIHIIPANMQRLPRGAGVCPCGIGVGEYSVSPRNRNWHF
jgi:hypothetical protein